MRTDHTQSESSPRHIASIERPQGRVLIPHDASMRESILADAPAAKLADVEDVRGALAVDDGHVPRRLSPENTQPELPGLRPLGLEACETAPHDAMTEVGLRPAVDGDVRGPGDERYRFRIGEEAPRPITKQRHEEDNAVLGQAGDRVQQLRHRQSRQIGEGDPVAVAPRSSTAAASRSRSISDAPVITITCRTPDRPWGLASSVAPH